MAWSDRDWILDGATVHVSVIGFDDGSDPQRTLDGNSCTQINADLTAGTDLTSAQWLQENAGISFMGVTPAGSFYVTEQQADEWMALTNADPTAYNREVLRPYANTSDLTGRWDGHWIVDYGVDKSIEDAQRFEAPFGHIAAVVKPVREINNRASYAKKLFEKGLISGSDA